MKPLSSALGRDSEISVLSPQPPVYAGGKAGLRVVLLREIPDESQLRQRWNDLVLQMERPEIFYTCDWALAVQSAYGASQKPLFFLAYEGDHLIGVAALSTELRGSSASFLTGTTSDYCDFVSLPQRRAEFVDALLAELRRMGVSRLVLANLPADSASASALRAAARENGFHLHLRPAYLCAQIDLGQGLQRQELQSAVAGKRQLRRCMKALEREGRVTFAYLRSWEQIRSALPDFMDAHVARFRAKHDVSFLSAPERQLFMQELARRFSSTGDMILSLLRIDDRPIAWSYGFQFHGTWFLYQTTFDIRCEENSPGYCLIARIILEACDTGIIRLVDLGLGAEAYKDWFANGNRQTLHATLSTSPLRHVGQLARYRLSTEVKRFPRLEAALRTARSRLGL
jgi:CelD/BcsL family acetyltransferase involved in cellulose biosynthesis